MKKKLVKILCALFVILYMILGTDFAQTIKDTSANVASVIKEIELEDEEAEEKIVGNLKVYFLDVGQADSILIVNENHNMLIDAGNNEDGEKLVSYFKSLGITSFDYVFATHAHEDHIGGMDNIINNFDIKKFYMPDVIATTKTFEDVLDALENKNLTYSVPSIDDEIIFGDSILKTLYVGNEDNDLNDSSIVLKLTFKDNSFLFTGDATSKVEKIILNKDLESDVLKIGHHGSSYSTTDEFLKKVNPSYAVISVGENNTYKHPTQEVLNKLKNIKLYRTDINGTVILSSDGYSISVETAKTNTNG